MQPRMALDVFRICYDGPMKKIAIVGFGRFGELLAELSSKSFDVSIVVRSEEKAARAKDLGYSVLSLEDIGAVDVVIMAVPISNMEQVAKQLTNYVKPHQVIVDVCSVKVYPTQVLKKHFAKNQILATHPMFGPDSAKKGLKGLRVAFCPIEVNQVNVNMLRGFWEQFGVEVIDTTPEEHDRDTVYSQAFSYTIAQILLGVPTSHITFTTRSFDDIREIAGYSKNDSYQLFHDMLYYNPYLPEMAKKLRTSINEVMGSVTVIEGEQKTSGLFSA